MDSCVNMLRRTLWLAIAAFISSAAIAQEIPPADARAMRAIIEAQLDAFRQDDAPRAFSYAAPGIRATFGSAEVFFEMVRQSYPVVHRPQSVRFDPPLMVEDEVVQPVRMTDAQGHAWLALYPMQRLPSGEWLINGCRLGRLAATGT